MLILLLEALVAHHPSPNLYKFFQVIYKCFRWENGKRLVSKNRKYITLLLLFGEKKQICYNAFHIISAVGYLASSIQMLKWANGGLGDKTQQLKTLTVLL